MVGATGPFRTRAAAASNSSVSQSPIRLRSAGLGNNAGTASGKDFRLKDALRLLLTHFDIEVLNCVNLLRFQRTAPRVSNFQINDDWEVLVNGRLVGELEAVNFDELG